jgi:hypothetical protein
MKKLNSLDLGKGLNRAEMKAISGGLIKEVQALLVGGGAGCAYYQGCPSSCISRKAGTDGYHYYCSDCCTA